jgi:hypothetical protein
LATDELVFTIFSFACCDYRLSVTEPVEPFTELGSAPVDSDRVSVPLPAETANRARQERLQLRAVLYGNTGQQALMWRYLPTAP